MYPVERPLLDSPAAQAAFVAAMCTPEPYAGAHDVAPPVRCIETHVSWVFLTGPCAYKVKKPVRLGFLDYGTAHRRAEFCAEELRLNRRHAPGLYLDVVGLHGTPGRPRVGPADGAAFEHAVRMVQFDPALELAHLVAAGALDSAELAQLGRDVAAMHASAARAPEDSTFGAPDAVHRVTLDNFAAISATLPEDDRARATLPGLRERIDALHESLRPAMSQRREAGFVRECHGDLHCGNVVRWGGRLVAFDGLEFDPALRYVDVANDVAFLSMDLGARGRDDLRHAVLDAWTVAAGDYAALPLLPYYEAYRALVRAKVTALRDAHAATADCAETWTYLRWAVTRSSAAAPLLVAMTGLSGSGKTWLARRLAATLPALHLRSDVERKRLAGLGALESSGSTPGGGIYTTEFNTRTYDRLRQCARDALAGGFTIIVDAASLRRRERQSLRALAASQGARFALVHCTAEATTLRNRVAARRGDASEATLELLERQPAYWEPLAADEAAGLWTVDTGDAEAVDRVIAGLGRAPPAPPAT